mgnify:FL=1
MAQNIALIPAAGIGNRFGAGKPKQYVDIAGKSVLQYTLDIFLNHSNIDIVAVVLAPEDQVFQVALAGKLQGYHCGGETRAETVRNGLAALLATGIASLEDNILVHDAARCCLPIIALNRLLTEAGDRPEGGILAVPVADTLKRANKSEHIKETVARGDLWQAQTPQLFSAGLLQRALSEVDLSKVTDEASAVEALGISPLLVTGDSRNLKMTLPQDEYIVRLLLQNI